MEKLPQIKLNFSKLKLIPLVTILGIGGLILILNKFVVIISTGEVGVKETLGKVSDRYVINYS